MRLRACILVALLFVACKKKTTTPEPAPDVPPSLGTIVVENATPTGLVPGEVKIDTDAIAADVRKRLQAAGLFGKESAERPAARVRIEIGLEEVHVDKKAAAHALVRFRVDTRPDGIAQGHWNDDVRAGGETTYDLTPLPDRQALFARLVARTVTDITEGYLARQRLWAGRPDELRRTLTADAGELRIEAIHAAGERRLTSEAPTLLELLSDEDELVRDAALGALVELRERRAVGEIARQRSMRDSREMRKIIDAIATLGGDEASDYLGFVAEAHDDADIKEMAKTALERMKRKATGSPAPTAPGSTPGP